MDCHNNITNLEQWYIQCPRDKTKLLTVYELVAFQRVAMDSCIWIRTPNEIEWARYNSLYFSNGVIGVYDPSDILPGGILRIEFEDPLNALTIERGLCFSFLNQFELGIENNEVIDVIKHVAKTIKY